MKLVLEEKSPGDWEVGVQLGPGEDPTKIPTQGEIGITLLKVSHDLLKPIAVKPKPQGPTIQLATPGQMDRIDQISKSRKR